MAQIWDVLRPVCLLLLTGSVIPGWIHIKPQLAADAHALTVRSTPGTIQPAPDRSGAWLASVDGGNCIVQQYPTVCSTAAELFHQISAPGSCESMSAEPEAKAVQAGHTYPNPDLPATIPADTQKPTRMGPPQVPAPTSGSRAPRTGFLGVMVLTGGPLFSFRDYPNLQVGSTPTSTSTTTSTATTTPSVTLQPSPSSTLTSTPTQEITASSSPTTTPTGTQHPTVTVTPTATITISPTSTTTFTPSPQPPPQAEPVLINEVAWAGTTASAQDEWIELFNPNSEAVSLNGWTLTDGNDLHILLEGEISPEGFFLLERSDDTTISNLPASQIYTGNLNNSGESLELIDPSGLTVDAANDEGGTWPAGLAAARASMERICQQDVPECWQTCPALSGSALDAAGNPVAGTPLEPNTTPLPTPTPTITLSPGPTLSLTPSPTVTQTPGIVTPAPPLTVLINEIAWAGTGASSSDEWIELYCPGSEPVNFDGWTLSDGGDINITLEGILEPEGYYLLERTDDTTVASILADQIYSGTLSNLGEFLTLQDSLGTVVDTAGAPGQPWPAGSAGSRASMEREGTTGSPLRWATYPGYGGNGLDAGGEPIQGTPRRPNAALLPKPDPPWVPRCVLINEVLMKPKHDWNNDGVESIDDEFIELLNTCDRPVLLENWYLDDVKDAGSRPYRLPEITLQPGEFAAFFRTETRLALNDGGDDVRLLGPDMTELNRISYLKVKAYNLSYGRLPDGSSELAYGLWPTPGKPNILFEEPVEEPIIPVSGDSCTAGAHAVLLPRHGRTPAALRMLLSMGLSTCPGSPLPQ